VLEPVVARYRDTVKRLYFRGDAAFANPEIYKFLEAEGMGYAIRLPANSILQSKTDTCSSARLGDRRMSCAATSPASAIRRKAGRNPDGSWRRSSGTPMSFTPRVGFIVSNLARPAERVVAFYNQRGTAKQWIKEGKGAIKWTRLSCRSFAANAVRLQLHTLAYNPAHPAPRQSRPRHYWLSA
jgi:hypothetical protein